MALSPSVHYYCMHSVQDCVPLSTVIHQNIHPSLTEAAASGPRLSHHNNQVSVGFVSPKSSCHTPSSFMRKSTGGSTHSQHTLFIRPHANITHRADHAKV